MRSIDPGAKVISVTLAVSHRLLERRPLQFTTRKLESAKLNFSTRKYEIGLQLFDVTKVISVNLQLSRERADLTLTHPGNQAFTSGITTLGNGEWVADFNKRNIRLRSNGYGVFAVDTVTGDSLAADEKRSIDTFWRWHVNSGRKTSEIARIGTTR